MGEDKAMLKLGGLPLIERAVALMRTVSDNVAIVGSRPDLTRYAPVIPDLRSGCGPLSGIEAALLTAAEYAIFIPVDLPLLPASLLRLLLARVGRTAALCTIPQFKGSAQPLCAVYHRRLLPAITTALDEGDYKVTRVVERAATAIQPWGAVDRFDLESAWASEQSSSRPAAAHRIFHNCNAPADFQRIANRYSNERHA